ncbi:MAG: YgiQ family radical SAM protein, partial [Candidatus Delongbacteria bacterium]|nr:YgiQ family radical SAM protein [Candidatus Delongbacteria bacterium]MCG2759680.1 YgiQ family radical SAM protein [Candidatus Delongbacteria bacterium]
MLRGFIPTTKREVDDLGWKKTDVIIVTGDAYIDHPYFQVAAAGRFLNSKGFKTAILDIPDIEKNDDWKRFGKPALMFLVIAGKEDSMAMNYTAFKKFRSTDPYIPGGKRTHRPDRAVIKYCNKIKELYKDTPIILAGNEAVCRMVTHYDFWSDKIRKPILFDSKADMILFGNIEFNLLRICDLLKSNQKISDIKKLDGTAYIVKDVSDLKNYLQLPSHESIKKNINLLIDHHLRIHKNQNPYNSGILVQRALERYLIIQKSQSPMTEEETDEIYNMGYKKRAHPKYKEEIPIIRFIKDIV